jgi:hypothetical protein
MIRLASLVAIGSVLGLGVTSREPPTFFTDRAAFVARFPDLPQEDFELGTAPVGGVRNCPGPLDASSDNACFSPGGIKPGVRLNSELPNPAGELALIGRGFRQAPSQRIVATSFQHALIIDFTSGNVKAVGMDLVILIGQSTCQIDVFGADGLLDSRTAPCTAQGAFWGMNSDKVITRIRIFHPDVSQGVDNLSFGAGITIDPVVIDIKPGSEQNPINLHARGVIPVAVLSTRVAAGAASNFDAEGIDVGTVAFGPGGAHEAHGRGHLEDVNGDGLVDMVFHFSTEGSDLACSDVRATLTGATSAGRRFSGTDAVAISCQR